MQSPLLPSEKAKELKQEVDKLKKNQLTEDRVKRWISQGFVERERVLATVERADALQTRRTT
ncbi:hypothetical protein PG984_006892 [Apiospora sp. TS-2023a]